MGKEIEMKDADKAAAGGKAGDKPSGDTSSSFDTLVNCPVSFGIKKTGDLTGALDLR